MLTTYSDDTSILDALCAGALGYLTKDAGRDRIAQAIHTVAAGQAVLDPTVHVRLLAATAHPSAHPNTPPSTPPDGLTTRETEVLTQLAAGHSNTEIAQQLFVSETTIKPTSTTSTSKSAPPTAPKPSATPTNTTSPSHNPSGSSAEAMEESGIEGALLVSAHRHRSEADALELLDLIRPWRDHVLGVGLGSPLSNLRRLVVLRRWPTHWN